MGGYGAATFKDTMEDIADVLVWINNNIDTTQTSSSSSNEDKKKENGGSECLFIFGYSLGGHVAASFT
eukprot:1630924-Ditylum_brightwellii.AAC.1